MRISDWSSDVCSSDLAPARCCGRYFVGFGKTSSGDQLIDHRLAEADALTHLRQSEQPIAAIIGQLGHSVCALLRVRAFTKFRSLARNVASICGINSVPGRSEEHTSELQSQMRTSTAVLYFKQ